MTLRDQFLLDPEVVYLNHGSFGACPRPVFQAYQNWQRELERQPVAFLGRRLDGLLARARQDLGHYVGADSMNLVFVPNATTAVNTVARSLILERDDEILTTDHEYGAMDYTWEFICQQTGAQYVRTSIPVPLPSDEEIIAALWSNVTPRTKVIFISHITSPTAVILPIDSIIQRARDANILTIIGGAHAPGQLPLDLESLGADFYAGNCHKWMCAPKGAGFLYARPEHHSWLQPLVISWGWHLHEALADRHQWQGTRDVAAFLAVSTAIEYMQEIAWSRERCHQLALETQQAVAEITTLPPIATPNQFAQMVALPMPTADIEVLQQTLYKNYQIEVPGINWNGKALLRVSYQVYNSRADGETLVAALREVLEKRGNNDEVGPL